MPKGIYKHIPHKGSFKKGTSGFVGYTHTKEWKEKMSGENHSNWIRDRSKLQKYGDLNKDRRSSAYREWRLNIYKRDGYQCKINNKDCSGRLEVHHILGYTEHKELRYDINNGITLCHFHHPRVRDEEKRLSPYFMELVSVSKE